MSGDDDAVRADGVGRRLRAVRKLAGLTQEQLATRAHVSPSLVRHVEQGRMPASPSFVAAAARALRISVPELYDQPTPRFGAERAGVADLETTVMAGFAPGDGVALTLGSAGGRVLEVAELQRHGRYDESSARLSPLLEDLRGVVGDHGEAGYALLARAYGCASTCLHRLGSPISEQASERAAVAARASGDPLLAAAADIEVGHRLSHRGAYAAASRVADAARASIEDLPADVDVLSVRGHAHLSAAIISARTGDAAASSAHLDAARECSPHVPDGSDRYDTAFSPSNVTMHAVAAAVEMDDGTTALARNAPVPAAMPSRQAHHHVDLARACLLHGDRDRTLAELDAARQAAPQLTRYHPQVHETLRVLAGTDHRRTDSLAAFARWAGVTV